MSKKPSSARLPFVVAPRLEPKLIRVGSAESGQIEIERRGYLTVAEKSFMSAATANDNTTSLLRSLAFRIARDTGRSQTEVMEDIGSIETTKETYLDPYIADILEAMTQMIEFQQRRGIIAATCLIMYRIDRNWTVEDTMELHDDIRRDLERLYEDEEAKNIEALEATFGEKDEDEAGASGKA